MNNIFIIDENLNLDYEMINQILINRNEISCLELKNIIVDLEIVNKFIKNTNIRKIVIRNAEVIFENAELIDVEELIIDNIKTSNYEFFIKFKNISKLEIENILDIFDCYYLRKLNKLKILKMTNLKLTRLGGLGYLSLLEDLYIYDIDIESWVFITKIVGLNKLYLNKKVTSNELFSYMIDVVIEENK